MSGESKSNQESGRNPQDASSGKERLPFEPKKNRKKTPKKTPEKVVEAKSQAATKTSAKEQTEIPAVVSQRMLRRMGLFSGIPTVFGISTFIISYFVVIHAWFKLPNIAVVLVSMGFFGLSVLGLSYGAISASWDEERPGSILGWREFTTNFGRLTEAWRSAKQKN
ncbi:PAM68 family protein [Aerosakkonemataceae cyanobacterium BLCC-F154]|uniref:PAM68 family protein n=1 Tax=Floridaenema fluviatile BLCC-F154 TaxID=3153640 RepID=A0ABV4YM25_9CYAN